MVSMTMTPRVRASWRSSASELANSSSVTSGNCTAATMARCGFSSASSMELHSTSAGRVPLDNYVSCNIVCYMRRDERLSASLHALLHLAARGAAMTSEELAECLGTHPVVVRRTMGALREAGLARSERGHGGGWTVARPLEEVSLRDVYVALGEP